MDDITTTIVVLSLLSILDTIDDGGTIDGDEDGSSDIVGDCDVGDCDVGGCAEGDCAVGDCVVGGCAVDVGVGVGVGAVLKSEHSK